MKTKKCEVHGSLLELKKVPIVYGLMLQDENLGKARKTLFPNSFMTVSGGCCVGALGFETETFICKDCRTAETKWRKMNKKQKTSI